jgi:hypothetical protein
MKRFTAVALLFATLVQAETLPDREECIVEYNNASLYLANTNAKLWDLYDTANMSFEEYSDLQNQNTIMTFDYFWRLRRNSHIGTVQDCKQNALDIRRILDYNVLERLK